MKIEKALAYLFIGFCLVGLIFSVGQPDYINRALSIGMFGIPMIALIWAAKRAPEKIWTLLIIICLLQVFSLKTGFLLYNYSTGLGYISYFSWDNLRHTSDLAQFSTFKIFSTTPEAGLSIGINYAALAMVAYLWYYKRKRTGAAVIA